MSEHVQPDRSSVAAKLSQSALGRASDAASRFSGGASTVYATGRFLRRHLWAWPVIAAVMFGGVGLLVHWAVEGAMRDQRATDLNVMVDASATAVRVWMGEQRINVNLVAQDEALRPLVHELLPLAGAGPKMERQLRDAPAQEKLRTRLHGKLKIIGYVGFLVVSPGGVVLASDLDAPVGNVLPATRKEAFDQAMAGKTIVTRPFRSRLLLADEKGELRANLPTMFVIGPLCDEAGKPIAALGLRIRPEDQFTRILQVVRFGKSGETYAFDKDGRLLSQSRFDDQLKHLGLLVNEPDARSILTVEIRDPEVNMVQGARPALPRSQQPLTRSVAEAVQGSDGCDADGYRDYRGVPSVGAWRWLPEYDFGILTEVDAAEAFRPVYILRTAFWALIALLFVCAVGIFVAMLIMARQQRALQKATLAARQLGQYALEEKLGAGGMGTVYRARHAMLRRPTAVKLLDVDKISDAAVARFEREVQLTSALTHPNTVAVFDYGRTPDGIFYYAMEYLEGMNLDDLVRRFGPLPEARALFLLRQICGSLAEAHAAGLVHRDIKPANIFVTRRGGLSDFVKVLDFGLAKAIDAEERANVTNPNALMGTPLYLSPEAVHHPESVDAKSDVYAVGAVGYFLLTGTPVFTGTSIMEICMKHAQEAPQPPSARLGKSISPSLEAIVMRCLAKSAAERPASAAHLLVELEMCEVEGRWTTDAAAGWWAEHEGAGTPTPGATQAADSPAPDSTIAYQGPQAALPR